MCVCLCLCYCACACYIIKREQFKALVLKRKNDIYAFSQARYPTKMQRRRKKWFVRLKAQYTRHEREHEHVKLPPLHSIASLVVVRFVTMEMAKSVLNTFSLSLCRSVAFLSDMNDVDIFVLYVGIR